MATEHETIKLGELELVYAPSLDMYSMTEAWKRAGSDPNKKPADWLRLESTKTYITFLTKETTNTSNYGFKPQLEFTRQLACRHSWAS